MPRPRTPAHPILVALLAAGGLGGFGLGAKPAATPQHEPIQPGGQTTGRSTGTIATPPGDDDTPQPHDRVRAEVIVHLLGGSRVTGLLIVSSPTRTVLRVGGAEQSYSASQIDSIEYLPPVLDRYRALRASIDPTNANQRLLLAEWLRDRELYGLALEEAEASITLDPGNPAGGQLARWLRAQIALEAKRRAVDDGPEPGFEVAARTHEEFPVLNDAEMNLIRVYEVNLRNPPRLRMDPGLIDAMFERYAEHPMMPSTPEGRELLRDARPEDLLGLLFRMRARELYPMVTVMGEPDSLARFRRDVHRGWLINACASNDCHGGVDAGRLRLRSRRPNSDETVLTNFLILDRFRLDDGTPLIVTDQPGRSPLLQFGLREGVSTRPHPEIERNNRVVRPDPVFRSTNDRRFGEAVEWIQSLYQPRPDYPIEYPRPVDDTEHDQHIDHQPDRQADHQGRPQPGP